MSKETNTKKEPKKRKIQPKEEIRIPKQRRWEDLNDNEKLAWERDQKERRMKAPADGLGG